MNLTYEVTKNGYKILNDGTVWIVQDGYIPYPKETLEQSAQAHIDEIVRANKLAEQSVKEEADVKERIVTLEKELAETKQKLSEIEATNLDLMEVALIEKGALINE